MDPSQSAVQALDSSGLFLITRPFRLTKSRLQSDPGACGQEITGSPSQQGESETTRPFSPSSTTRGAVVPRPSALGIFIPAGGADQNRGHQRVCFIAYGGSLLFLRWFGGSGSLRLKDVLSLCGCPVSLSMELGAIVRNWG